VGPNPFFFSVVPQPFIHLLEPQISIPTDDFLHFIPNPNSILLPSPSLDLAILSFGLRKEDRNDVRNWANHTGLGAGGDQEESAERRRQKG
jgi:hypothetical protein